MFPVAKCRIPVGGLLSEYNREGAYTDCFTTELPGRFSFDQFVTAFYTTRLFRAERVILKWLVSKPSTDEQLAQLIEGKTKEFAAWSVEAQAENQLLLCDFKGRTRSWLKIECLSESEAVTTRLYFGSAVIRKSEENPSENYPDTSFNLLLGFHTLYSKALLYFAKSKMVSVQSKKRN